MPVEHIQAEELAYWYLRLNGCLTIPNFVVHPDSGSNQRTDIDVLAARFPFRGGELPGMKDDEFFERCQSQTLILLTEVKTSRCSLNRAWLDAESDALEKVICAAGFFPRHEVPPVATSLRESGQYRSQLYRISFLALGGETDEHLATKYPEMPQILWRGVLVFIHARFRAFRRQKRSHPQWDNIRPAALDPIGPHAGLGEICRFRPGHWQYGITSRKDRHFPRLSAS